MPYHSKMSTSPSGSGSSFTAQNAGQAPVVRQSSLIRASHVVLIMPSPVATQFAAVQLAVVITGGEEDEIGVAVEENVAAIVAVYRRDRRPHIVLPALHGPIRRIGPAPDGPSNSSWNR